jgi:hypothetical protein|tara:strand:- start:285 stop:521 length:237 start_codon:yes stop_codon:yes gene_type:complete
MAKAKATPKTDDGTIARDKTPPKATPLASQVEKTESFTAAFKADAHASADHFLADREEVGREESDAGNEGTKVTITYK